MRRLLACLVLLPPAAALSQTAGQIAFAPDNIVNKADCDAGVTELDLTWSVTLESDAVFATTGNFQVYASNTQPTGNYCSVGSAGTGLIATVSNPISTVQLNPVAVTVSSLLAATALTCSAGDKTLYVCVQWNDVDGNAKGYARGNVELKVTSPAPPVIASVGIGDTRLKVRIKAPTGTPLATDFRARAVAWDAANAALDPGDHFSSLESATGEATIEDLVNGVAYKVTAYAYTDEGNVSTESGAVGPYVPRAIQDAWERYQALGGVDSGGCQAGAAGLLALLGAAPLLRLRRRS